MLTQRYHLFCLLFASGLFLSGCASGFQGIRLRAQDPQIDEAFRKLTLAATVDGYTIAAVDPVKRSFETDWREMKEKEKTPEEAVRPLTLSKLESKVRVQLKERGRMYDVELLAMVRQGTADPGSPAPVPHPLREKWERLLRTVLTLESRDED
jgi:hypothetical protein